MEGDIIMKLVKGKKYEVVKDLFHCLNPGEIVVALEEKSVSYFVELSHYKKGVFDPDKYFAQNVHPLSDYDVKEVDGEDYTESCPYEKGSGEWCEYMILSKLKEIKAIAKEYDPNTKYLAAFVYNDQILFNNNYWEDGVPKLDMKFFDDKEKEQKR